MTKHSSFVWVVIMMILVRGTVEEKLKERNNLNETYSSSDDTGKNTDSTTTATISTNTTTTSISTTTSTATTTTATTTTTTSTTTTTTSTTTTEGLCEYDLSSKTKMIRYEKKREKMKKQKKEEEKEKRRNKKRLINEDWNERELMEKLKNDNDDVPYACRADICREIWTYSREKGDLLWPDVPVGTVHSQKCPYSLDGSHYATFRCKVNAWGDGVEWVEHKDDSCPKPPFSQLADVIKSIIQNRPQKISCKQVTQLTSKMVETQQKYVTYPTLSEDFQFVMHFLFTQNLRCVGGRGYLVNGANDTIIELAKNNNNNINNKNNKNNNKKNNFYEVINNIIIINDEEEEEEDEVGNLFNFIDTFFYPNFLAHWQNKEDNFTKTFQVLERFSRVFSSSSSSLPLSSPSSFSPTPSPLTSLSSRFSTFSSLSSAPSSSFSAFSSSSSSYKALHISHTNVIDDITYFEYPNNVSISIKLSGKHERRIKVMMIESFSKCKLIPPIRKWVENIGGNVTEIRPRVLAYENKRDSNKNKKRTSSVQVFKNRTKNNKHQKYNGLGSSSFATNNIKNKSNYNNNNNNINNKNNFRHNNRYLLGGKRGRFIYADGNNDKNGAILIKNRVVLNKYAGRSNNRLNITKNHNLIDKSSDNNKNDKYNNDNKNDNNNNNNSNNAYNNTNHNNNNNNNIPHDNNKYIIIKSIDRNNKDTGNHINHKSSRLSMDKNDIKRDNTDDEYNNDNINNRNNKNNNNKRKNINNSNRNNNKSSHQNVWRRHKRMADTTKGEIFKNNNNIPNTNNKNNFDNNKNNNNSEVFLFMPSSKVTPALTFERLTNVGPLIYVNDDVPASKADDRKEFDVEVSFYFETFLEKWHETFPVKYLCARLVVNISEKNFFGDESRWRFDCLTTVFPSNQSVVCSCRGPAFVSVFYNKHRPKTTYQPEVADVDVFGFRMTSELVIATMMLRGISIAALLATTFVFSFFKKTRKGVATKILLNLCVSLMLLLFVLFITEQRAHNRKECPVYNVLRYYLCMVTLMWNGVEGHNMHQMLVKVFNARVRWYVRKAAIVAWSVPALIVMIVLVVDLKAFHGTWKECIFGCSLKPTTLYIAWLTPMALIVLHNIVVFAMVLRALSADAPNHPDVSNPQRDRKSFKQRLTGAIALLVLLGIPWLLSAFAAVQTKEGDLLEELQFAVGVVFTVFISIQGIFIFFFHCLRNQHVKTHLTSLTSSGKKMFSSTSGSRLTSAKRSKDFAEENKMADIEVREDKNDNDDNYN